MAVVAVMSVQPTSANFTALHEAGSAAWAGRMKGAAEMARPRAIVARILKLRIVRCSRLSERGAMLAGPPRRRRIDPTIGVSIPRGIEGARPFRLLLNSYSKALFEFCHAQFSVTRALY
jgi:hypothetical protein